MVLTPHEWREKRIEWWLKKSRRCAKCNVYFHEMWQLQLDHIEPRGMGGGKRDDRDENLQALCYKCNHEKGSKRESQ